MTKANDRNDHKIRHAADGAEQMNSLLTAAIPLEFDHEYRLFAVAIQENEVYLKRVLVFALPGTTDGRVEVCGTLVTYLERMPENIPNVIDWIEVNHEHRRRGLGTRLWNAAEKLLVRKLEHAPVTKEGIKFARSFETKESVERKRVK